MKVLFKYVYNDDANRYSYCDSFWRNVLNVNFNRLTWALADSLMKMKVCLCIACKAEIV